MHEQAQWTEKFDDAKNACALYVKAGDYEKALELIEAHRLLDALTDLASHLDKSNRDLIKKCSTLSHKFGDNEQAEKLLLKLDEPESLVQV